MIIYYDEYDWPVEWFLYILSLALVQKTFLGSVPLLSYLLYPTSPFSHLHSILFLSLHFTLIIIDTKAAPLSCLCFYNNIFFCRKPTTHIEPWIFIEINKKQAKLSKRAFHLSAYRVVCNQKMLLYVVLVAIFIVISVLQ